MAISLTYDEKIAVVDLGDDENRFSPGFLDEIDCCLDDVVGADAQGLVTTGGGRFYSNARRTSRRLTRARADTLEITPAVANDKADEHRATDAD